MHYIKNTIINALLGQFRNKVKTLQTILHSINSYNISNDEETLTIVLTCEVQ